MPTPHRARVGGCRDRRSTYSVRVWSRRREHAQRHWLGLDAGADVLAVLSPAVAADAVRRLDLPEATVTKPVNGRPPRGRQRDAVLLLVRNVADLRRTASGLPGLGTASLVAVVFDGDVDLPMGVSHPQWPRTEWMVARREPWPHLALAFSEPVAARAVLLEVARASGTSRRLAAGWPHVGVDRQRPDTWPVADPSARVAAPERLMDQSVESPPDLVLLGHIEGLDVPAAPHHVLGRPSTVVRLGPEPTWQHLERLSRHEQVDLMMDSRDLVGAVDDHLFNPVGFDRKPTGAPVPLPPAHEAPGEREVRALREVPGVTFDWRTGTGPLDAVRRILHLAAAGVPVVGPPPAWAAPLLGEGLTQALSEAVDLTDRLRREEVSVRQRRAALSTHGSRAWRRGLAARHGAQQTVAPTVSVLLASRRPDMLDFALRQVSRQREVEVELVLATHGFEPAAKDLAAFRARGGTVTHVRVDSAVSFGRVLNRAVDAASGDVLVKMDDDDWYGPDFLFDLLLALDYSGADVVGCPPEFTYLAPLDITTRSDAPTEVYRPFVAGGTIMTTREVLREVGGFRDTVRYVDANLLAAVTSSGGAVYRAHGLGYMLRRGSSGHTWDPGLDYFLGPERAREQWRGFRPSALLKPDNRDVPPTPPKDGE